MFVYKAEFPVLWFGAGADSANFYFGTGDYENGNVFAGRIVEKKRDVSARFARRRIYAYFIY